MPIRIAPIARGLPHSCCLKTVEPGLEDEVPGLDSLTAYDKEHFKTYLRFLDASADDASYEEMAKVILVIDSAEEPRAQSSAEAISIG